MPLHTILIKPVSGLCNMQCDYCFYCDETEKREVEFYGLMSEETLKNIIKKSLFQAEGDICFAFQGGEPTLRGIDFFKKVLEFEQRFNRNGVSISNAFQTNGFLLNKEWCQLFHDNHFLIGVSVDGTKVQHDRYRHDKNGNPTYDKVRASIRMLDDYQVEYNILTVINKATALCIRDIYKEYKQNGWFYQQYITCLDPYGEEPGQQEYSLTPKAYGEFLIELFNLWYKDWKRGKSPYIRQFENYIGVLLGCPPESCEQRGLCSVQCVTESDGSTYPCDFYAMDEYKLGNFNENRISDFFENPIAKQFVEESKKLDETCLNCPYYRLCRGACRRSRIKDGDTDTYHNYFCEGYKMFFEKCGQRMIEIADFLRKV